VLGQARAKFLGIGRVAVDLDEAHDGCEPAQEAEPGALGFSHGVGFVTEVGLLGLW